MDLLEEQKRWKRQIILPATLLEKLYLQDGFSTGKIATMLNCSQDTISRRLRKYGIERRVKKKKLPKEEILSLYVDKKWSIKRLAQHYQCSHTTIGNRLREWKILLPKKTKPLMNARNGEMDDLIIRAYLSGNSADFIGRGLGISRYIVLERLRKHGISIRHSYKKAQLNLQELRYLYVNQHMSTIELSELYKVKSCTIAARLREAGVPLRGNHLALDKNRIEKHYSQGMSVLKIAETLGCSYTAIKKRLVKWGIYQKRSRLEMDRIKIIQLYEQEQYTLAEIADRYNCCENTIANLLRKAGVARRKQGKRGHKESRPSGNFF